MHMRMLMRMRMQNKQKGVYDACMHVLNYNFFELCR